MNPREPARRCSGASACAHVAVRNALSPDGTRHHLQPNLPHPLRHTFLEALAGPIGCSVRATATLRRSLREGEAAPFVCGGVTFGGAHFGGSHFGRGHTDGHDIIRSQVCNRLRRSGEYAQGGPHGMRHAPEEYVWRCLCAFCERIATISQGEVEKTKRSNWRSIGRFRTRVNPREPA